MHAKAASVAEAAIMKENRLLTAAGQQLNARAAAVRSSIASSLTSVSRVQQIFDEAKRLSQIDVPTTKTDEPEHSIISFQYSSPQLKKLATELPKYGDLLASLTEDGKAKVAPLTAATKQSKILADAVQASSIEILKTSPDTWVAAFTEKLGSLQVS